jgi:hypothetical protein
MSTQMLTAVRRDKENINQNFLFYFLGFQVLPPPDRRQGSQADAFNPLEALLTLWSCFGPLFLNFKVLAL